MSTRKFGKLVLTQAYTRAAEIGTTVQDQLQTGRRQGFQAHLSERLPFITWKMKLNEDSPDLNKRTKRNLELHEVAQNHEKL